MAERTCRTCGETRPIEQFREHGGGKQGRRWSCIPCQLADRRRRYAARREYELARARAWQVANRDRTRGYDRKRYYANLARQMRTSRYGLTPDDYFALVEKQRGVCAICKQTCEATGKRLAIDHDHVTGNVRGLLCFHCNSGLGKFRENPALLQAAIDYLT